VTAPFGFFIRSIDIRRCRVHMDDGLRTRVEQLVMDDSDATADVQQRCAAHADRSQLIEQQASGSIRPLLSIAPKIFRRVSFSKLRLITLARTAAHGLPPRSTWG